MKFEKNCKYYVNGEGFEAILYCYDRINHRDGSASVSFFISDLKVIQYTSEASTFLYRLYSNKKWYLNPDLDHEFLDYRAFFIDSNNKTENNFIKREN